MAGVWSDVSVVEELATAGSGTANAIYFAGSAVGARGPRRIAMLVLVALFAGSALSAGSHVAVSDGGTVAAALRLPLLIGNVATFSLILAGAGR